LAALSESPRSQASPTWAQLFPAVQPAQALEPWQPELKVLREAALVGRLKEEAQPPDVQPPAAWWAERAGQPLLSAA
jgi:hypothetical protein